MSTLQLKEQRLWLMTPIISLFSIYVWYLPKLFIIFATCVLLLAWRYSDLAESPRRKLFLSVTILLSSLELFLYFDAQFSRDTSVCLMIAMCVFKWFEIRSPRDYLIIIYLYFFLAITVFLYHQSLLMSCYVACIIVNIFFTWAHIHLKQKQIRWNLSRPVVRLVLLALPGSILIFLLLPRLHYPLFWFGSTTNHAVSGLSERMLPGAISSLSLSNEISFRAKFSQEIPDRRDLYWRVLVLTRTDGISWDQHPKPLSEKIELPQTTGQKYTYQLILEASGKHWIPALDLPVTVPPEVQQAEAFQLRSMTALSQRTLYQLQSSVLHRDLNADITALQQQRFIPPHLNPLARALAGAWRRQAHHDRDIIEAAKEYFQRRGFRYRLTPPLLDGDQVDAFLFNSKTGFCEHFATSFAFLMRAAGLPTRIISGYQGGEYNANGGYFVIRQRDAHAWNEVYIQGLGWERIDPTAWVEPTRIEAGSQFYIEDKQSESSGHFAGPFWDNIRQYSDAWNTRYLQWILSYKASAQKQWLALWLNHIPSTRTLPGQAFYVFLIGLVSVIIWLFRSNGFGRGRHGISLYRRFLRLFGIPITMQQYSGPLQISGQLVLLYPHLKTPIEDFVRCYIDYRYGRHKSSFQYLRLMQALNLVIRSKRKTRHLPMQK